MSTEIGIESIWINEVEIENVDKYKFLGQIVTFGNRMDKETEQRIWYQCVEGILVSEVSI